MRTFLEKHAELREYEGLILSTTDLANLLLDAGKISHDLHEQARKYLLVHDNNQGMDPSISRSVLDSPIYLDDLAVTYLQQAQFLSSICRSGIDVKVHPSMNEEQSALVAASREGERLYEEIGVIQAILREAIEDGTAVFLPRQDVDDEKIGSMFHFISDTGPCDILCIDDRFMNRHGLLTDKKGRNVPIMCTLDLISHLENQGLVDTPTSKQPHKLREAGFGLIPVTLDELERFLRTANFDPDNNLIEGAELRGIRQYLMRVRSLDMIQSPLEAPFLTQLRLTTASLLFAGSGKTTRRLLIGRWHLRVGFGITCHPRRSIGSVQLNQARMILAVIQKHVSYLIPLFSPMGITNIDRHRAFLEWVERAVVAPLLPANNRLIDHLADSLKLEIHKLVKRLSNEDTPNPDR